MASKVDQTQSDCERLVRKLLNQQEDGSRRPSLGRAGDGIERRTFTATPIESAEQFRKTPQIRPPTGVEKAKQDSAGQVLAFIFREAARNKGVVMWPNGAVVVRQWIVTSLSRGDRADTPASKRIRP